MPCEILDEKKALRARIKSHLRSLRQEDKTNRLQQASQALAAHLECHPRFIEARRVLLFCSLPDEPDTLPLLERWGEKTQLGRASKQLYLPVVVGDDLEVRAYYGTASLRRGAFNILEPTGELFDEAHDPMTEHDLIVVPGVAFTADGYRLGRGRGYYDRLLSRPAFAHAYTLGYAFPFQIVESLPVEPHDVKLCEVLRLTNDLVVSI